MFLYLVKRVAMTAQVLLLVTIFISLLSHVIPGDPARTLLGPLAKPELVERYRVKMGLDQPVPVQVARFVWNVLHGSFGTDAITGREIGELIAGDLPYTLVLAWTSLGLAVLVGIPLGVYSATHPDSWPDRVTAIISISCITIPSYVAGLFLLLVFAVELKMMPAIGVGEPGDLGDQLKHLILPAVALAVTWVGYLARLVRASLMEVMNETYIRAAMASGLSLRRIQYKYALKNSLIPTVAMLAVGLGNLMGGAVFVEIIFSRPGMGTLIYNAIKTRNYPIVQAGVLVIAFLFVLANLIADFAYTWLDPRIQLGKRQG